MGQIKNIKLHIVTDIKDLTLVCVKVTDIGLEYLSNLEFLTKLDATCDFTDAGMPHLLKLSKLKYLSFDCENEAISDTGMQYISELHSLTHLSIPLEKITDKGLLLVSNLTNLQHLYIHFCHATDEGVSH